MLSTALTMDPTALITNWSTRFGIFQEYRTIAIRLTVMAAAPDVANSAYVHAWWDENNTGAPTANDSFEQVGQALLFVSPYSTDRQELHWRAADLNDLGFTPLGTAFSPVTYKQYTSAAWGGLGASKQLLVLRPEFLLEFRGLKTI